MQLEWGKFETSMGCAIILIEDEIVPDGSKMSHKNE